MSTLLRTTFLVTTFGHRSFRTRSVLSQALHRTYKLENRKTADSWPPLHGKDAHHKFNMFDRSQLLHHLRFLEISRMEKLQPFRMPEISPGDLVEVRYELSRTQQTQALFQGYCVEVRNKDLDSSFVLKNTYDGVGVTQLVPKYSPRLLNVRVAKKNSAVLDSNSAPTTKDFRYKWHRNVRHRHSRRLTAGPHKPGIRSLEPRLQRKLSTICSRYFYQRSAAGLPPYTYASVHPLRDSDRRLEIRAEIHRRSLVYTQDEIRKLRARERRKKAKTRWGTYKIAKVPRDPSLTALPMYHPLLSGNLPRDKQFGIEL